MVVASTFAMADVDGTNFYLRTEEFGVAEVIAPALQPGVHIQPRLRKDPGIHNTDCASGSAQRLRSAARLLVVPLNGERSMAQSSPWFFRLHNVKPDFRALASLCCLCVRYNLYVLLLDSFCKSCARQFTLQLLLLSNCMT